MLNRRGSAAILLKALLTSVLIILPALTIPVASKGNFAGHTDRSLRYRPDGTDFVIENGAEFFNRPLYGTNTAFRVDAGDRPEFSLYLPGRGGNLRLGIKTNAGEKWLFDADQVLTRYRPGSMLYEIRDPLLGRGRLTLTVLPMGATEGLVLRVELQGTDCAGRTDLGLRRRERRARPSRRRHRHRKRSHSASTFNSSRSSVGATHSRSTAARSRCEASLPRSSVSRREERDSRSLMLDIGGR